MESELLGIGFSAVDLVPVPGERTWLPGLLAIDTNGTLWDLPNRGAPHAINGNWGNCLEIAMYSGGPLALLTSGSLTDDRLTLLQPYTDTILIEFPVETGPIIDLALGDIDRDGRTEILVAVLEEEGVKIYY
jgi:hypothetical protein